MVAGRCRTDDRSVLLQGVLLLPLALCLWFLVVVDLAED
jgi:hypothetical protein